MLVLAHGIDLVGLIGVAYFASAPGLLMYGAVVIWAFSRTRWRRKVRAAVAVVWGVVFPAVYLVAMVAGGFVNERLAPSLGIVVCSGISALALWVATGKGGPATGCAMGCALSALICLLLPGLTDQSPFGFMLLSIVWAAPVLAAMVVWARDEAQAQRRENACVVCGYDLSGLPGLVCPECGGARTPEAGTT